MSAPTRPRASSPALRWVLTTVYVLGVLYLLSPVLLTSVGADDRFWILEMGPVTGGSEVRAWLQPVTSALDFRLDDRATALAFANRQLLDVWTMNTAVRWAISPTVLWALAKVSILAISMVVVRGFCRSVRFRGPDGAVSGLSASSITTVTLASPLLFAVGEKAQNLIGPSGRPAFVNGWIYYPTLGYAVLPGLLVVALVALRLHDVLARRFGQLVLPVLLVFVAWGVVIDFSYEALVVALPVVGVVLLAQAKPESESWLVRWRAALVISGALTISWGVGYLVIRRLSGAGSCSPMRSGAGGTGSGGDCYSGTVISIKPAAIAHNILASLPLGTRSVVGDQARQAGVAFPGPTTTSVLLGLGLVLVLAALLLNRRADRAGPDPGETRGLVLVAATGLVIALATAVLTAITSRSVTLLTGTVSAYRVGPPVWAGLVLALVAALLVLWSRWKVAGRGAVLVTGLVALLVIAVMLPRNELSAQSLRRAGALTDYLQSEVAVGAAGRAADGRRCSVIRQTLAKTRGKDLLVAKRSINDAYAAYAFYHHRALCSTMAGFTTCFRRAWGPAPDDALPCFPVRDPPE